jgi:hypothetical protein
MSPRCWPAEPPPASIEWKSWPSRRTLRGSNRSGREWLKGASRARGGATTAGASRPRSRSPVAALRGRPFLAESRQSRFQLARRKPVVQRSPERKIWTARPTAGHGRVRPVRVRVGSHRQRRQCGAYQSFVARAPSVRSGS